MRGLGTELSDVQALLLFFVLMAVFLVALVRYERRPGRKVVGRVTRLWYENAGRLRLCWIEVEIDGVRQSFTCDCQEHGKASVGAVVRLQLKGSYVEHIRRRE